MSIPNGKQAAEAFRRMNPRVRQRHVIHRLVKTMLAVDCSDTQILATIGPQINFWKSLKPKGKLTHGCDDERVKELLIAGLQILNIAHTKEADGPDDVQLPDRWMAK